MPRCTEWGHETSRECSEWADHGTNACNSWADRGYSRCCTWWPCSWLCRAVYWVANIVCTGWYWIANLVCVVWTVIVNAVCLVWEVVSTIYNAIIVTLESLVGWIVSAFAFLGNLILSLPVIGRFIAWLWNLVLTLVSLIVGAFDSLFYLVGIRPEKKLRVSVIVLRQEDGRSVVEDHTPIIAALQQAINEYSEQANIRIIPSRPFQYNSAYASKTETATEDWISTYPDKGGAPIDALDVQCEGAVFGTDLTTAGPWYESVMSRVDFYGNARRLAGYGAPITIFVVRRFVNVPPSSGCSMGPLTNYVTVRAPEFTIHHELGHACNILEHSDDPNNIMIPTATGTVFNLGQILLIRASRHVTYF